MDLAILTLYLFCHPDAACTFVILSAAKDLSKSVDPSLRSG